LIVSNNIGQQVVDILHNELEYENIFRLEHHSIKGQSISAGFKRSVSFGLKTTKSVKKIGCANLKTLVENDKLIIEDFDTISELNTFVRVRDSYEAEEGNNDDIVMTLVFFSWLVAQSFFKENTNSDIRQRLMEEHNLSLEEEIAPVGVFDDGRQEEIYQDGDDLWTVQERGYFPSTF
jgi:chemotaxis protein histidine kinase CheA